MRAVANKRIDRITVRSSEWCESGTLDISRSPELGGDGRGRGEVGELLPDAGEEEPREAVAVDDRDAGGADPPDEPEADHAQVPPQPVPGEPADDNKQHGFSATISFHRARPPLLLIGRQS